MRHTITLTASARYGYGGKQYIARITGRDAKYTFDRRFVGTKGGKRREDSEYQTDEPGLYVTCDLDSKGRKDETYWLIERQADGGLDDATVTREQAMLLARLLDDGKTLEEAVAQVLPPKKPVQEVREFLAAVEAKDQAATLTTFGPISTRLRGGDTSPCARSVLTELARAELARLEAAEAAIEVFDPCA